MADNVTLEKLSAGSGAYPAGTTMATIQNGDDSHSQRVVVDGVLSSSDPLQATLIQNGVVSSLNTTTTPLAADAVFTGQAEDVMDYVVIMVSCAADASSATDGLELQFSHDGSTWFTTDEYTYNNGLTCKTWANQTVGPYFRIKYTNGGSDQTEFYLCVQYKKFSGVNSAHRVADNVSGQDDAALTKTILMAEQSGGTPDVYTNINATAAGNLKASIEEVETDVAIGILGYRESDTSYQPIYIDETTNNIVSIDHDHSEIHEGKHYFIQDTVDLPINNVFDMQFTTGATSPYVHFVFEIDCEGETEWYIYENVTINTPGTSVTPVNNNRNSSNTSTATVATITNTSVANANADTAVASATTIAHGIVGAGRIGGNTSRSREIILKANEDYSFRAIATAAGYTSFNAQWYEHVDIA